MFRILLFLSLFVFLSSGSTLRAENSFLSARPVWPAGQDTAMNLTVGFRAEFEAPTRERTVFRLAASSLYRFFINGEFAGHGPARGPHGHFRIDEWDITGRLRPGRNIIAVEVTGYNINSYYLLDQPAFLQAEAVNAGRVLVSTGGGEKAFEAAVLPGRVREVQRYSFQRTFSEYYRLNPDHIRWRNDLSVALDMQPPAVLPDKQLLPRRVPIPDFQLRRPVSVVSTGTFSAGHTPDQLWMDRALTQVGTQIKGFRREELDVEPSVEMQGVKTVRNEPVGSLYSPDSPLGSDAGEFLILDYGTNLTGFIGVKLRCRSKTRLFFAFDEILVDGDVDFKRLDCVNLAGWELEPGDYAIETLEPYTLRYLKLMVMEGGIEASGAYLREYANPEASRAHFASSDPRLSVLFEAARQTFRQNAVDIFMDCPSRERAGWLCDSYFIGRAATTFCGNTVVEKNFLENFVIPDSVPKIPRGMLPMCYPANSHNGAFIPNWAMWFVLQLEEYAARSGDTAMLEAARGKVTGLIEYLRGYRNADGLLEKLPSWVFVEWSEANEFVQDVNYPSNMLYAAALAVAARMYGIDEYAREAEIVRRAVCGQSFDGTFFVDNAVRGEDGILKPTRNRTETCQYYAFYLETATPRSHPELWKRMVEEFGPRREKTGAWPEVYQSRPFIGNVLRLEALSRQGLAAQALEESRDYLLYMAEITGTLWEMQDVRASCNHGFASHTAHFLVRDVLGLKEVDTVNRGITLQLSDPGIDWCEGRIPSPDGDIFVRWWKEKGDILYRAQVPAGYGLTVINNTGGEIRPGF